MSESGVTSFWAEHYETPPLDGLDRVEGREAEDWLNHHLPFVGSAVEWSRVRGHRRHWFAATADEMTAVVIEFLAAVDGSASGVVHVGDSLSPCSVRIAPGHLADVLEALLAIPEHHYFVAEDRSWCGAFRMEGDVDLALLGESEQRRAAELFGVLVQTGAVLDEPELGHFTPLLRSLVALGNVLVDGGFVPSQSGPVCHLARPLDRAAVQDFIATDPQRLSYDLATDTVHCRHCWGAVTGGSA